MRRWTYLVLLAAAALTSLTPALSAQQAQPERTLNIVETSPAAGVELAPSESLIFYFDAALDCATATDAVTVSAAGDVDCSGASLTYTPSAPLADGAAFSLTIADSLRSVDGAALAQPYTFAANVRGFLEVTSISPTDSSAQVTTDSTITVVFNRPVVALTTLDAQAAQPQPLTFDPPLAGQGKWIGTSIYQFTPDEALEGGVDYSVTVDGVRAVDGASLAEPFVFSFSTQNPEVTAFIPTAEESDAPLAQKIQVTFNQAMDRASTEAAFFLSIQEVPGEVDGTFTWNDDDTGFMFTPEQLTLETAYTYGFAPDEALNAAQTQSIAPFSINFYTANFPVITKTYPADGQENVPPYDGIILSFSSLMNPETLADRVLIDPAPTSNNPYFSEYNNEYTVNFPLRGGTTYTVEVLPGMEDVYGNTIDEGFTFTFTTGDLQPEIGLNVPYNGVGMYDAGREDTVLYLSHMNVDSVDLSLYQVSPQRLGEILLSDQYYNAREILANTPGLPLVKNWTIEGADLQNVRRLDLLDIGAAGEATATASSTTAVSCPGALTSRAHVGDRARIITDPNPVRARSAPVNGDIVELLYRDYAFSIVGGPDCRDGIVWWEIELRTGDSAWIAEGAGGEYFFEVTNAAEVSEIPLSGLSLDGGPLPTGVYLLKASMNAEGGDNTPIHHVMVVADTALMVKRGLTQTMVWATDIHTGLPAADTVIFLLKPDGSGDTKRTDADGLAIFERPRQADDFYDRFLAATEGFGHFGMTASSWSDGLQGYYFNIQVDGDLGTHQIYMYTDRPVYRPGQPVHYRGVVRARPVDAYLLPETQVVRITAKNSDYVTFFDETLTLSEFGTFEGTFTLDADALLGYYTIDASLPEVSGSMYRNRGSINFDVAEYRLPEFQVQVSPDEADVLQGDSITASIDTTYFFGGPVANAEITYYVTRENYFFDYTGDGAYSFYWASDDENLNWQGFSLRDYNEQTGTADAAGMLNIEIPAETGAAQRSLVYTIEATAMDESGQTVSGRTQVVVHQADYYVGVAPRDYIGSVGQPFDVDVITVDWGSAAVPNQALTYTVYEMRWNSVQELSPYTAEILWRSELEQIEVASGTLTTDANGNGTFSFTPETGGSYKIVVTGTDAQGNTAISSSGVWVSGGGYVAWRQTNATAIQLIADKSKYEVGDVAEILIPSPFMGRVEALVTIERENVLRTERITLESNSTVYRLPIEEGFAPNVYIGVVLVKGVDETQQVADMRIGYLTLNVDNAHYALNIDIESDTELAGPRDTVTYTLRTTDHTGAPVRAELGVALTDLAALSLGADYAGDILDFFYGFDPLSIMSASGMVLNTDLITLFTRDVIKGGGGGGGGAEFGIIDLREQFIDTAFWDGAVVTDANGEATVTITLPDNLTTWRLVVRGVTDGVDRPLLVGQDTLDIVATKPLIVRPVAPRFMTRGDIVTIGAVVNNNTSEDLTTAVTVQAEGVAISEDLTQTVTIPAKGVVRVNWTASVGDAETVELIFAAEAGDFSDATRPAFGQGDDRLLPVYAYEVPEYVGTGGALRSAATRVEAVVLPRRYTVSEGALTVVLEPSLAVTSLNAVKAMESFNCECIETTASRLLANVAGLRALNALGAANDPRIAELTNAANLAIQRLAAQQRVDGGWGWYASLESSPLVTAWTVIALKEASLDLAVDEGMISRAASYLAGELTTSSRSTSNYELNRAAILVYALAKANHSGISAPISNLYDIRDRLGVYAKALLLDAILMSQPDDAERLTTLRDDLLNAVVITANGAQWQEAAQDYYNWNSNTRTTAIVLRALLHLNPDEPLLPNAVRWLTIARRGDLWETTQETAWSLLALTDWMRATGETQPDYTYSVSLNDEDAGGRAVTPADAAISEEIVRPIADLNPTEPNLIEIARGEGEGALYYTAYLNAYLPVAEVQAVSNGLSVTRTYRTLTSDEPVTSARVGELVEVTVTVIAPNALNFIVIEDPLPAGAEVINPNLNTAQQTGTDATFSSNDIGFFNAIWWADVQYYDEKVVLSADYVAPGTYEFTYMMRASVEGTYNVIPTTGREFYLPEVYGRGEGSLFTVLPTEE